MELLMVESMVVRMECVWGLWKGNMREMYLAEWSGRKKDHWMEHLSGQWSEL